MLAAGEYNGEARRMRRASLGVMAAATALLTLVLFAQSGAAQKRGGILKMYDFDSPPTMSILEEATASSQSPMMGVFNNLVLFDQHQKQNRLDTIIPDLATDWSWSEDGTALTFHLREGVKWHDGELFTAKDVLCTWDLMMETGKEKLRFNPRKSLYKNLDRVTADSDNAVTFHLKRPQPAFLVVLAGGFSALYPCHVPAAQMRQHPIGTGPFKFVEFKQNEAIRVTRNPGYWKPGLPYLDGIDYTIIKDPSTAVLAFIAGNVDMTFPFTLRIPQLKDVQSQVPQADCEITPGGGINAHLLVNRDAPPFNNFELRKAMALAIDRKAFIDIIGQGQGDIGGVLQPPPGGEWGMPPEMLQTLPGYDPDIEKSRSESRRIMQKLGYGPTAEDQGGDPRSSDLSRFRGPADRSAEAGLFRRRARPDRHIALFPEDHAQGVHRQSQPADQFSGSNRSVLRLWCEPQLGRLLQSRGG